ncbi:DDE-type integrase/transposase/recombinase [Streptomyces sp. PSKA54]|uniref:DDE-type integrase/transposase/recombinase n=1 Tax=Streptomyces himalayensis subsp. aureolus TaxID=2758039 RepID=A0A7W2D9Q3_9ACTN|nr:DDE-type integrase/transposase/recombinase [Streptomyces himalayensis subsp. aureolus]
MPRNFLGRPPASWVYSRDVRLCDNLGKHRTTIAHPAAAKAPDLIGRDFTAAAVNTKYVGDITYLQLANGKFLYLATVIDLASRRLAGWALADHMRAELVIDALAAAERTCGSLSGAIMHNGHFVLPVMDRDMRTASSHWPSEGEAVQSTSWRHLVVPSRRLFSVSRRHSPYFLTVV